MYQLVGKLEDEQGQNAKQQRANKELMSRISELEEELDNERQSRSKAERARADLQAEIEELSGQFPNLMDMTSLLYCLAIILNQCIQSTRHFAGNSFTLLPQPSTHEANRNFVTERLDEAGGATSAQMEMNKKRDAELAKLKRDIEEMNMQHDTQMSALRKKNNDAVAEIEEQLGQVQKQKAK